MYVYIHMYICMCVYICIRCVYTYTYMLSDRSASQTTRWIHHPPSSIEAMYGS